MVAIDTVLQTLRSRLQGESIDDSAMTTAMVGYTREGLLFEKDFFTTKLCELTAAQQQMVDAIVAAVAVSPPQSLRFKSAPLTIKQFLDELHALKPDNAAINLQLTLINQRQQGLRRKWWLLGAVSSLMLCIPVSVLVQIMPFMDALLGILSLIPVFGAAFTVGLAGYSVYQFLRNPHISFAQRFFDNTFFLLSKALQLVGYSLLIAGMLSSSYLVAGLFVGAELVLLAKEAINLFDLYQKKQHLQAKDLDQKPLLIRAEHDFSKERNKIVIDILVSLALAATIGVMCFFTGGMIIPVACLVAIGVIYVSQHYAKQYNEKVMDKQLQKDFANFDLEYTNTVQNAPDLTLAAEHTGVPDTPKLKQTGVISALSREKRANKTLPPLTEELSGSANIPRPPRQH